LAGINISDLRLITSAWIKRNETGLIEGAANLGLNIRFIPKEQIDFFYLNGHSNKDIERSEFVFKHTGVYGVCEPCALIASDMGELILKKTSFSGTSFSGITIAIAKENPPIIF
jgi:cobalamin biosynthesis protein CbiG